MSCRDLVFTFRGVDNFTLRSGSAFTSPALSLGTGASLQLPLRNWGGKCWTFLRCFRGGLDSDGFSSVSPE